MAVRFPEREDISYDLSVVNFKKGLRATIADELTAMLECRADAILLEVSSDEKGEEITN